MSKEVDISTMKKCVEDAGILEKDMSEIQLKELYNVLQDSVCGEEVNNPNQSHSADSSHSDDFVMELEKSVQKEDQEEPTWPIKQDLLAGENDSVKKRISRPRKSFNMPIIYDWKAPIHFNDMPPSDDKDSLPIIHHKLKYVGIQNSPEFLSAPMEERVKMLCEYHVEMAKIKTYYARQSSIKAPLPPPIIPTEDLPASFYTFKDEEIEVSDDSESYVSRSGRMTKRKVYYDEDDEFESASSKKSKNGKSAWFSKNANTKSTKTKKSEHLNSRFTKENNGVLDSEDEKKHADPKEKPRPRLSLKKLSNDQLMERSSLFKDISNEPKSRNDVLFGNLAKAEKEKQKTEKSMEMFNKTLDQLDEGSDMETEAINVPARNPIGSRKKKEDGKKRADPKEKPRRWLSSESLSDDEITKGSSLFKHSSNQPKSPNTILFDEMVKDAKEKQRLDQLDEGSDMETENINIEDDVMDDTPVTRKRVVPTLPARKPIGSRKKKVAEALPIRTAAWQTSTTATASTSRATITSAQEESDQPLQAKTGAIRKRGSLGIGNNNNNKASKPDTGICPICSSSFALDVLVEHAATCGEGEIIGQSNKETTNITCHICDKVVPFHTSFDNHVRDCINRARESAQ